MTHANASNARTSTLSKQQRYWLVGIGLALLLIFGGVLLQVVFPSRGEPFAPAPGVVQPPSDVPEEDMEGIPPEIFDEDRPDSDPEGTPGAAPI